MIDFLIILPMVLLLACGCLWNATHKLGNFCKLKDIEIGVLRQMLADKRVKNEQAEQV